MRIIGMKISPSGETYKASLDNGECIKIETETVVKFHLKEEKVYSDDEWQEIMDDNNFLMTKRRAFNILSYHAQSKKQLYLKLREKTDKETAQRVVDKMVELGLCDDQKLLEEKVRQLLSVKKYGKRRIVSDLSQKGFDVAAINNAIEQFESDDFSVVCEIIEKKYTETLSDGDYKSVQKVTAALMRRGFDYDTVRRAINEYTN